MHSNYSQTTIFFFFFFKLSNVIHYMNLRLHYQLDLFYFAHMEHLLAWPK